SLEPVIDTYFKDDDGRLQFQHLIYPREGFAACLAADAGIYNAPTIAGFVKFPFDACGVGFFFFDSVTGGETVAQTNDGSIKGRCILLCRFLPAIPSFA